MKKPFEPIDKAKALYQVNHTELRLLARDRERFQGISRTEAMKQIFQGRSFWIHGDYSKPASKPAQAALICATKRYLGDLLDIMWQCRQRCTAEQWLAGRRAMIRSGGMAS
jgi:hypothetical protein